MEISKFNISKFNIRKVKPDDIDDLLTIADECNLSRWTRKDYEEEIARPDNVSFAAIYDYEIIGFIATRLIKFENDSVISPAVVERDKVVEKIGHKICECEIFNIAVLKRFQKRGVGKKLLNKVIEKTDRFNKTIFWLEVRNSNRQARKFYKNELFEEIYKRKNYYRMPTEDAVVMKREC